MASSAPIWGNEHWAGLPALDAEITADLCVVGLGGSGLTCILELLESGLRVVGVDAASVGSGAAGRNGGFLLAGMASFYHDAVATFGRDRARRVYQLTLAQIDRMTAETPEAIRRVGSLRLAATAAEDADCLAQLDAMQADSLVVERYEGPEGTGLLIPTDGAFEPALRCRALARRALAAGARLFEHSRAQTIATGSVRIGNATGRVSCDRVVVAVDGRLEQVLPELAGRVRTARLQMLATAPTSDVFLPRPVYSRWGMDYWQQLPPPNSCIVLGGFRDRGGDDEWTSETRPTAVVQEALERFLRSNLGVRAAITHRWAASVAYSATGLPVLEEVRPGVLAAGAYSGTGNVLGALCGRGAAELVTRGRSEIADLLCRPPRS